VRAAFTAALVLCLGAPGRLRAADGGGGDSYEFAAGKSEQRAVTLAPAADGVTWSWSQPSSATWDTALVGVRVNATDAEPSVEIATGSGRIQQYLDPGARGLRWLNLTGLKGQLANGATVAIAGHGVAIDAGAATLRVFANGLELKGPILILAPHPDDAEIAAFGLYSGSNATIVTVTCGNAGDANYADNVKDPARQYMLKGYLRAVDSVTTPWQGGIPPTRTYNLGYFDARLKTMREKPAEVVPELYGPNTDLAPYRKANFSTLLPNTSRSSSWNNLVADLAEIFRKVKPAIVVMPYPQLDSHNDHQYTAVAAFDALAKSKLSPRFLLYTNHATGTENRYPYGPAGSVLSLPPYSGAPLTVQGVYAHPVSADLQLKKLFALETMHDLRLSPAEQAACGDPNATRRSDYPRVYGVDYLRRGPRPQELFFVYDRAGMQDVLRAFLAAEAKP
jgi:LmbE family N-acetylglucosaminyl deacetylase